jgi:hypothetical protein
MTDVLIKATKIKRRAKLLLFISKRLTKAPSDSSAVISDLFPIRNSNLWKTEFELLNVLGLIVGENNQKEPYSVKFYFYNCYGKLLGVREIDIKNVGRTTVKIADLIAHKFEEAATFAVFHPTILGKIDMLGSYLAERGYCGYEYLSLGVKGYVHGNLDAVALSNDKVEPLGNSGLISRYYTVQHCLRGPAKYEFVFTNPTPKTIKIIPNISLNKKKWLAKKSFTMNSLGSHTFTVDVKENEKAYVRFKSKLYLGRPVVFRISNDSMDVFHG